MPGLVNVLDDLTVDSELVDVLPDGAVRCLACAHRCMIRKGRRGIWDKYLFDRRDETFLSTFHYQNDKRIAGGCLRVGPSGARSQPVRPLRTPRPRAA